jgi:cyclic pyranopterin phosphate synthase
MVDVTGKAPTHRRAVARARVMVEPMLRSEMTGASGAAGVLERTALEELVTAAAVSGRYAAKVTSTLIPLCHPLTVSDIHVRITLGDDGFEIEAEASTFGRTGVEMEALTACACAALSLVSACGAQDPSVSIEGLTLLEKVGGRSGHWTREAESPAGPRTPWGS